MESVMKFVVKAALLLVPSLTNYLHVVSISSPNLLKLFCIITIGRNYPGAGDISEIQENGAVI
jgi:hypothetical protein